MDRCKAVGCRSSRVLYFEHHADPRCRRHEPYPGELDELDRRARAIGFDPAGGGQRPFWCYGPNVHVWQRRAMIEWAEQNRLTIDRLGWHSAPRGWPAEMFEHSWQHWFDHGSFWRQDGIPRLALGQPYHLSDEDKAQLQKIRTRGYKVRTDAAGRWYGFDTLAVIIVRP